MHSNTRAEGVATLDLFNFDVILITFDDKALVNT